MQKLKSKAPGDSVRGLNKAASPSSFNNSSDYTSKEPRFTWQDSQNFIGSCHFVADRLRRDEHLYWVDNDTDQKVLTQAGYKAINYFSLHGTHGGIALALSFVLTGHDCKSIGSAYQAVKRIANSGGAVAILDPFKNDETLPISGGKTFSDFLIDAAAKGLNTEAAVRSLHSTDNLIWEHPSSKPFNGKASLGFSLDLQPVGHSLQKERSGSERFVWDETMPRAGTVLLTGLPKAGKTVLAEAIAVAVSTGESFLGRSTKKGRVIYFAFEGNRYEIERQIKAAGGLLDDSILIHAESAPETRSEAIAAITEAVITYRPVMVVIDTLQKALRASDMNAYAHMSDALERFSSLAQRTNTLFLFSHHNNRSGKTGGDAILGSTALFGGVDCHLSLKNEKNGRRILSSTQRIGTDLPPTVISMDSEGRLVIGTKIDGSNSDNDKVATAIKAVLKDGKLPEKEIKKRLKKYQAGIVGNVLRRLVKAGEISKTGGGVRGNPFVYELV